MKSNELIGTAMFYGGYMRITLTLVLFLITFSSFATENLILECADLGEGNITKLQIFTVEDGKTHLREFYEEGAEVRVVKESELNENIYKLSSYYGYTRSLKKVDGFWRVEWGCGESFEAACYEF